MTTYWVKSGTGGDDSGSSWSNAAESIPGLMAANAIAGGDIIYVHNTHAFIAGAIIIWTLPESGAGVVQVLCVDGGDPTGASLVDGTVGSLATGAVEETGGNFAFNVNGPIGTGLYVHGMTFKAGSGASQINADIVVGSFGLTEFNACTFWSNSSSASATPIQAGSTIGGVGAKFRFVNCAIKFFVSGQSIFPQGGDGEYVNCVIIAPGSGNVTALFKPVNQARGITRCYGCDWSLADNVVDQGVNSGHAFYMHNCVINTPVTGTNTGLGQVSSEFMACAAVAAEADILAYYREDGLGVIEDDQTVYLDTDDGAKGKQADGAETPYSLKITSSTKVTKGSPICTPWMSRFVGSTGDKTITLRVAHTESAVLTTSQIWMEVVYMGEPGASGTQRVASSPHAQLEVDDDCDVVSDTIYRDVTAAGSNRTDTGESWAGITGEKTHTLTASVNCADIGYIRARVCLAVDTTNPVYINPKIGVV